MKIWRFHFIKLCFAGAGVVGFELACLGLNWLPCISLSSLTKYMVLIGLRFQNQALLHLPSTFANEFLSGLNCKVNLIHANVSSIISCSTKRLFRATLLWTSHAFPTFCLHSLAPFLFLHKLIGPLMQEVNPHLKCTPPHPQLFPGSLQLTYPWLCLLLCSASFKLLCFPFLTSGSCSCFPAVRPLHYLCHCHRKMKVGLNREKAHSGACDGNPKQQRFQLNQARLTKALEFPTCAQYFVGGIQPKLLSGTNIFMREMILVAYSIVLQEPVCKTKFSRPFTDSHALFLAFHLSDRKIQSWWRRTTGGWAEFPPTTTWEGILHSIPFPKRRDFCLNWAIIG